MEKKLIFFILVLGTTIATAQNQENTYTFTGTLISAPGNFPTCANESHAVVYEFEIETFSDASYTSTNIPIVVECPGELDLNFFKLGGTYKIEVFDFTTGDLSIYNQTVLDDYNLSLIYYAGDIKKLN